MQEQINKLLTLCTFNPLLANALKKQDTRSFPSGIGHPNYCIACTQSSYKGVGAATLPSFVFY